MNPSPLATPYRIEALFFAEELLLWEPLLALAEADEPAVFPLAVPTLLVAVLLPETLLPLDVDVEAVPALAFVVPDFRI